MSTLTLITGTIERAIDIGRRFDTKELYYNFIYEDYTNPGNIYQDRSQRFPIVIHDDVRGSLRFIDIFQTLGAGKTLAAIQILATKALFSGTDSIAANIGLIWHNQNKKKDDEWTSKINSLNDLNNAEHCTVLIDDIYGTITNWNTNEAAIVSSIANASRKRNLDIIITAQYEIMIPPAIRRIASEWIVPIIRVRDMTRKNEDRTGYPLELITVHFDGVKVFTYISDPLINLEPLFTAYNTLQRAIGLKKEKKTVRMPILRS